MWDKQSRFTALVEAYSADLHRYAQWLCGDPEVAEDVVQETFTRAWKSLDRLRDQRAAKAWLITTLRRENARRFSRKQLDYAEVPLDLVQAVTTYDTSSDAFALRNALAHLSEDYREPLLLQVIGGFSIDEIAEEMEITTGAATTRLFRARQKMKAVLEGDEEGSTEVTKL